MVSATLDLAFELPAVRPLEIPMAFTGAQLQRLLAAGKACAARHSPLLQQIVERVEELRGSSITWAWGLSLNDLITWSVRMAKGSVASLPAPLTFFKIEHFQWIPKVVINVCPADHIDPKEFGAYHTTCRRASIEFLTITEEHIAEGYLDSKHFKRAFNGAFFCDRLKNSTIFCPTLRDWGFYSWPESSLVSGGQRMADTGGHGSGWAAKGHAQTAYQHR